MLMTHAEKAIGHGKVIRLLFFESPFAMIFAALSAGMKNGIGNLFFAVMRDATNPGQMTLTSMFSRTSRPRKASPHARTAVLLPEYAGADGSPLYPARELRTAI